QAQLTAATLRATSGALRGRASLGGGGTSSRSSGVRHSLHRHDHAPSLAFHLDDGERLPVLAVIGEVHDPSVQHVIAVKLAEDFARLGEKDVANPEGDAAPPRVPRIGFFG